MPIKNLPEDDELYHYVLDKPGLSQQVITFRVAEGSLTVDIPFRGDILDFSDPAFKIAGEVLPALRNQGFRHHDQAYRDGFHTEIFDSPPHAEHSKTHTLRYLNQAMKEIGAEQVFDAIPVVEEGITADPPQRALQEGFTVHPPKPGIEGQDL